MDEQVRLLFRENAPEKALEVCDLLLELCRVLISGNCPKALQNIGVSSDVFQKCLLSTSRSTDILFLLGYQEGEDCFHLPPPFNVQQFLDLQSLLHVSREATIHTLRRQRSHLQPMTFRGLPSSATITESTFQSEVLSILNQVQAHETSDLQQRALSLLPLEKLKSKTEVNEKPTFHLDSPKVCPRDLLLLEVLAWFKSSFFQWVDHPNCPWCNKPSSRTGPTTPDPLDLLWGAHRVEAYTCPTCQVNIRFPRFNDPGHLLFTRKGRCGEWANCFLLFLRALGYDARLINDGKDHVWTEAYSFSQERWLHCDPCECACDTPLLYQNGWKKELSYVYAYAADHIQDVTWRYTFNYRTVITRRTMLRESWLLGLIQGVSTQLQESLSPRRRQQLLERRITELVEFLTPNNSSSHQEERGRQSGSLSWRLARGEAHVDQDVSAGFVFKATPKEIAEGKLEVAYSPSTDKYLRLMAENEHRELTGWSNGARESSNIFRKEELDWKKVYLCIQEGSSRGHLTWSFLITEPCRVARVSVVCRNTVFQKGMVWLTLSDGQKTVDIQNGEFKESSFFEGAKELTLKAHLACGDHWQHAQLFRTDTDMTNPCSESPLHITLTLHPQTITEGK